MIEAENVKQQEIIKRSLKLHLDNVVYLKLFFLSGGLES